MSDMEDGEVQDSDDEGEVSDSAAAAAKPPEEKFSVEVQARLDHPERLDKNLCYNDRGEVKVSTIVWGFTLWGGSEPQTQNFADVDWNCLFLILIYLLIIPKQVPKYKFLDDSS